MKFIVCFSLLVLVVYSSQAHPVAEEQLVEQDQPLAEVQEVGVAEAAEPELHSRQKRATCDLLSKWNVNHTACAAHCLAKRFKGGYCNNKAICVCRR
ncbi:defensin [Drosophila grimshawi]|uniref:GH21581 n=1 Tax=Drosophila grimshawi TaxID=7222 RepID=B4J4Y4_DROGR|nr:defensin [Drosophila grimshawi]EDW01690.1 GH21581 [Drosophila grimshawi]